jgi:hypothetical protein
MHIQVQRTAKALDQRHGPAPGRAVAAGLSDLKTSDRALDVDGAVSAGIANACVNTRSVARHGSSMQPV